MESNGEGSRSKINLTDDSLMDESRECISLLLGKHRKEPKNEKES